MEYKGIKIYQKVIIVEKTSTTEGGYSWKGRTVNQGYVVEPGNKKMLDNALSWARWTKYPNADDFFGKGKRRWDKDITDEQRKAYDAATVTVDGIIHEYDNGQFEITLDEAAGGSSQGGKLSFWNCIITAPDGHTFLVGINSELLLHLMMHTTLVKGLGQDKVWLGRVGGTQVGVFTPNMEDFKQAIKDEEMRQTVKTASSKYNIGDIVETLQSKDLYLGTVYKYYDFNSNWSYRAKDDIIIYKKPQLCYVYRSYYKPWNSETEVLSDNYDLKNTKVKRVLAGHTDLEQPALEFINDYNKNKLEESLKPDAYSSPWTYAKELFRYGDNLETAPTPEEIKQYLTDVYNKYTSYKGENIFNHYQFIYQ